MPGARRKLKLGLAKGDHAWTTLGTALLLAGLGPRVYVTVDIDGFDPATAPGTGTPEPGGLDWFQVTDLLRAVSAQREIVGADVMEVSPQPPSTVTEFLAARLIHYLMGLVVAG